MKRCLFCKGKNPRDSKFCSVNCYQKYRYNNLESVKIKVKQAVIRRGKERYHSDKAYREKAKSYSRQWQLKNPERVREISRKSGRKQYYAKKELKQDIENFKQ